MDKWNGWYIDLDKNTPSAFHYGDTLTYSKGYEFLKECNTVEDWGCGAGGFKRFFLDKPHTYRGIDGSDTPFANIKADLVTYTSVTEGLFMRHILEHNYQWKEVLQNALNSFTKKMCIVLFTPFVDTTKEIAHNLSHGVDVPDLSFSKDELISIFDKNNLNYTIETHNTDTGYNIEHIIYITK